MFCIKALTKKCGFCKIIIDVREKRVYIIRWDVYTLFCVCAWRRTFFIMKDLIKRNGVLSEAYGLV